MGKKSYIIKIMDDMSNLISNSLYIRFLSNNYELTYFQISKIEYSSY
jgi:hypothetical protein